mmetsp:Transcript_34882/g.78843  ORF Transcript_34882/g.78843 Transcript_34882/m.78843 type:complete len:145 (-) Transcript_34882:1172-1606(-)
MPVFRLVVSRDEMSAIERRSLAVAAYVLLNVCWIIFTLKACRSSEKIHFQTDLLSPDYFQKDHVEEQFQRAVTTLTAKCKESECTRSELVKYNIFQKQTVAVHVGMAMRFVSLLQEYEKRHCGANEKFIRSELSYCKFVIWIQR